MPSIKRKPHSPSPEGSIKRRRSSVSLHDIPQFPTPNPIDYDRAIDSINLEQAKALLRLHYRNHQPLADAIQQLPFIPTPPAPEIPSNCFEDQVEEVERALYSARASKTTVYFSPRAVDWARRVNEAVVKNATHIKRHVAVTRCRETTIQGFLALAHIMRALTKDMHIFDGKLIGIMARDEEENRPSLSQALTLVASEFIESEWQEGQEPGSPLKEDTIRRKLPDGSSLTDFVRASRYFWPWKGMDIFWSAREDIMYQWALPSLPNGLDPSQVLDNRPDRTFVKSMDAVAPQDIAGTIDEIRTALYSHFCDEQVSEQTTTSYREKVNEPPPFGTSTPPRKG